jgi:hypothetical protein
MKISLQGDILVGCMVVAHIHTLLFQCGFDISTNLMFWIDHRGGGFYGLLH